MGRKAEPLKYNPNTSDDILVKIICGEELTCEETAEALGMTKMNVSIIERKALAKLRTAMAKQGIKSFHELMADK